MLLFCHSDYLEQKQEHTMWNFFGFIKKHLSILIPASMVLGFSSGLVLDNPGDLKAAILPLTILMILPMMVTFPLAKLFKSGLGPRLIGANAAINFLLIPITAYFLARLFFSDQPGFFLGVVLMGLIPTSGMTISWTGFSGGNVKAAVGLTVFGLLAGALLTPVYLELFMGSRINISLLAIFKQIILTIFIPLAAGTAIRLLLTKTQGQEKFENYWKKRIPSISSLGVIMIVFTATAMKARGLASHPELLLKLIVPALLFYLVLFTGVAQIGKRLFNRGDSLALLFSTVMRNLSLAMAVAVNTFPEIGGQAALFLALGYVIQVQAASLYVRTAGKAVPAAV